MKIENASVTISFDEPEEVVAAMSEQDRLCFLQSLSCQDEVIEYVMQQVFNGYTDDAYSGSEVCAWDGDAPLQKFRKWMIEKGCNDQDKKRIEYLESELQRKDRKIILLQEEMNEIQSITRHY